MAPSPAAAALPRYAQSSRLVTVPTHARRYDVALKINVLGAENVLDFAKRCEKLQLFLHVSTGIRMTPGGGHMLRFLLFFSFSSTRRLSQPMSADRGEG